jgi:hypothetical protein
VILWETVVRTKVVSAIVATKWKPLLILFAKMAKHVLLSLARRKKVSVFCCMILLEVIGLKAET